MRIWSVRLVATAAVIVALTGCPPDPGPGAGTLSRTLTVDGQERQYLVHPPANYTGIQPLPLLLALHPFTGSGGQMEKATGLSAIADRENFVAVYPYGLNSGWNDGSNNLNEADDVRFISAVIDAVSSEFSIDPARIFATGASSGAFMCYRLASSLSDRIAAIAPVMGSIPEGLAYGFPPAKPTPTLFIHGTDDPIVPFLGGTVQAAPGLEFRFLSAIDTAWYFVFVNGLDANDLAVDFLPDLDPGDGTSVLRAVFGANSSTAPVHVYVVFGGGHTWPGGDIGYPSWIVGRTSRDISASELIWQFFREVPVNATP